MLLAMMPVLLAHPITHILRSHRPVDAFVVS